MKLTDPEKLILIMLSEVHEHLKIGKNGADASFVQKSILDGQTWALYWKFPGIFESGGETPDHVKEVCDIFDMWSFIESSYERLSSADKARVKVEAEPFGAHVKFSGFDGNNEGEQMSVARFLVEDLDRYQEFKGRDFNSHIRSLPTYRRMLAVFHPIWETLSSRAAPELTVDEIIAVLKEKTHPEYRASQAGAAS
jgi:uncharacterized protein YfbU (UPF0304 family)